jgi:hypothetical protein
MHVIEFETVVKDKTIHLPEDYAEFDSQTVKVILMMNQKKQNKSNKKEKRLPGSAKGKIFLANDFEQPLDNETIKLFYQ